MNKRWLLLISVIWLSPLFGQFSPGPLVKVHEPLGGATRCDYCHDFSGKVSMDQKCLECHTPIDRLMKEKQGFHGTASGKSCATCHPDHLGTNLLNVQRWPRNHTDFDHKTTGFDLQGKHKQTDCRACHQQKNSHSDLLPDWLKKNKVDESAYYKKTWLGLDRLCGSCHTDPHENRLGAQCESCHNETDWHQALNNFDHSKSDYPLTGKHKTVSCEKCHPSAENRQFPQLRKFKPIESKDCIACHQDVHKGQFTQTCSSCHSTDDWHLAKKSFDHNTSRFRLLGKHRTVTCDKCHPSAQSAEFPQLRIFKPLTSIRCVQCHDDFHKGKLGTICENCHIENSWKDVRKERFNHDQTGFILKGAHKTTDCVKCHKPGEKEYKPAHEHCYDCHEDIHKGQFNNEKWQNRCESCHTETGFSPSLYGLREHNASPFPLNGAHFATPCFACHKKADQWIFKEMKRDCLSCHTTAHPDTFDKYGNCTVCHNDRSWQVSNFNHSITVFPLSGKHITTDCADCHTRINIPAAGKVDLVTKGRECSVCHSDIHSGQFQMADGKIFCDRCHQTEGWKIPAFDHSRLSSFPLDGKHINVECSKCHLPQKNDQGLWYIQYKNTASRCEDCHRVE